MIQSALISPCGRYRYFLSRRWGAGPYCIFIMLNPSTADAEVDDATIRKCIGFAKLWGCGGILVVNLFAFRATKPADLRKAVDPVGPDNHEMIRLTACRADLIVCAWGNHGGYLGRDREVLRLLARYDLHALRISKTGQPGHPLYVPYETRLMPFGEII